MLTGFFNNLRGHDRPSTRPNLKTAPAGLQTSMEQPPPTRRIEHQFDHPKPFQFSLTVNSLTYADSTMPQPRPQCKTEDLMGQNTGGVRSVDHYQAGRKAVHFLDMHIPLMSVKNVVTSPHNNSRFPYTGSYTTCRFSRSVSAILAGQMGGFFQHPVR